MEEADALCTRVGIMAEGSLKAIGTQLHLKNKFGYGYRLQIIFESESFNDSFVFETICIDAVVIEQIGSTIDYDLPKENIDVTTVFKAMNAAKAEGLYGIRDWALSHTSLEEVFVNISGGELSKETISPRTRTGSDVATTFNGGVFIDL